MKSYSFKLTQRGLCSELNSLVAFYSFVDKNSSIHIDTALSQYFGDVSVNDIFDNFCTTKTKQIETISSRDYRNYADRKFKLNLSKKECANFFKYTNYFNNKIIERIEKLDLPKTFDCLHVRRGDKVGETLYQQEEYKMNNRLPHKEANKKETIEYLNKLENNSFFIMTDDFAVINEFKKETNKKIYYLVKPEQRGHSTHDDKRNNKTYTEDEILNFFAEIEVAKMSNIFIGTKTSNVFRYIQNQCTTNVKFITID